MSKELPCTECTEKTDCALYTVLDNTLNSQKKHCEIEVKLRFVTTLHNEREFVDDFKADIIPELGEHLAELSANIADIIEDYECDVAVLGGEVEIGLVKNARAFELISNYIGLTHGHSGN